MQNIQISGHSILWGENGLYLNNRKTLIQPVMMSIVKGSINNFIRTTGIMLSCQSTYKEQTGREVVNWIVTPSRSKAQL